MVRLTEPDMMNPRLAETTHYFLKEHLINEFEKAEITQAEFAKRLRVDPRQVRRLLDPQTSTGLAHFDAAFKALGLSLSVEILKLRRAAN